MAVNAVHQGHHKISWQLRIGNTEAIPRASRVDVEASVLKSDFAVCGHVCALPPQPLSRIGRKSPVDRLPPYQGHSRYSCLLS